MIATNPQPPADQPPLRRTRVRGWLARPSLACPPKPWRRWGVGGLLPAVLFALAPKCLVCVAAYVAAGAAFRFGGPEICGATAGSGTCWLAWLAALGLAAGIVGFFRFGRRRRA